MEPRPVVLSPATPSQLLEFIISQHRHPTTLIIGSPKHEFLEALVQDVRPSAPQSEDEDPEQQPQELSAGVDRHKRGLFGASLMQVAVSRHIRVVFTPTVTHLRAYLATFSSKDSKIAPPPESMSEDSTPLLLVYGFLNIHRDGSEWSAQGIGNTASALVEAAVYNGLRAAVMEPLGVEEPPIIESQLAESIPLLSGTFLRGNSTWNGRTIPVRRVFDRWFIYETVHYSERSEEAALTIS
ncbi:hypothetical protein S40285_03142 [Stachybotrys chlorohalonatus IBT 40285]|uniref:Uncharacterized protein n=1 Tax=Stachybotrys chlorohalonatus (strain IBT 40285) TaxID=1283841 RepID=A0A084QI36_STAC4|nr:hypothetical protein S40285_03142 [Stachybotrys chlorohalonata IBT 40285]